MHDKLLKRVLLLVCVAALAAGLTACGSSSSSSGGSTGETEAASETANETASETGGGGSSEPSGTLTIGMTGDTEGLSPTGGGCGPTMYCYPDYDSLIHKTPEGEFTESLATSWKFTDKKHQTFELTLREGIKFTDGTELTGEAVANSIEAFRTAPGPLAANAFPIDKVKGTGKYSVAIHYSVPTTEAHALGQLVEQSLVGTIVGPKGLADQKALETSSDGIGPYVLEGSETTKGSQYVYVPNPTYYNQEAIKYEKIILKPIASPSARLSAIQSGQIDWAQGLSEAEAETAETSGLRISEGKLGRTPAGVQMMVLAERNTGPLASQQVRQAINYAVPREEITAAIFGENSTATSSLVTEGDEGFNPEDVDMYEYNVDKAKKLLAEAGYSNGITIKVLDGSFFDPNNALGQALAGALKKAGITLELTTSNVPPGNVVEEIDSKKYGAFIWNVVGGTYSNAYFEFAEKGGILNPFGLPPDKEAMQLIETASLAPSDQQEALMMKATTRFDELAWAVPVATVPTQQATKEEVQNVPTSFTPYEMDPFSPDASEAWYTE